MRNFLYNKSDILIAVIIIVVAAVIIWTRVDAIMNAEEKGGETPNTSVEEPPAPDTAPTDGAITGEQPDGDGQTPDDGNAPDDGSAPDEEDTDGEDSSEGDEPVEFTVEVGSSASRVADDLESMALVESADAFLAELIAQNAETKLKAGTFKITPGTSLSDIVKKLTN
jgi:hypothetical protein